MSTSIRILIISTIFFLNNGLHASNVIDSSWYAKQFDKLNKAYKDQISMSFTIKYSLFDSTSTTEASNVREAFISVNRDRSYYQSDSMEVINGTRYYLLADHKEHTVTMGSQQRDSLFSFDHLSLFNAMKEYCDSTAIEEDSKTLKIKLYTSNYTYNEIVLSIDKRTYFLNELHLINSESKVTLLVTYYNYKFKKKVESGRSIQSFITKKNGVIELLPAYSNYTFINHLLDQNILDK